MWARIASFILRNRILLLILIGLATGWMAYKARELQMSYNYSKVIPQDDPDYIDYMKFKEKFGEDGNVLALGIESNDLFHLAFFNDLYDVCENIEKIDGVERILSITKAYSIQKNDSLGKLELGRIFNQKPASQVELDSLSKFLQNLPFYRGLLLNDDGKVALIAITLKKDKLDSKERIRVVADIEALANAFGEKHQTEIHYSGLPYIRTIFATKVKNELIFFTFLSMFVTCCIMWLFFRSFLAVWTSLLIVLLGVIYTMGITVLLGYRVTIMTGLVPPLMVIIGIQNCIYQLNVFHFEFRNHGQKALALTRVTSKNGLALFLTNVTTAIGFGVFNFSGSSLLDEFAVVSAVNIMVVWVLSGVILPIVFSFLKSPSKKQLKHLESKRMASLMDYCNRLVFGRRRMIYIVTILIVLVTGFGITRIKSVGFIVDDIPKKDKIYTDLKFFEHHFKGIMPFEIWIDSKKKGGFRSLKNMRKVDELQQMLSGYSAFSRPFSALEMLKFSSQAFHNNNPEAYAMPSSDEFVALSSYLRAQKGSKQNLKSLIDSTFQSARVSVQMADIGSVETGKLRYEVKARIDSIFPPDEYTVKVTGTSLIVLKGNEYLIDNLTQSMIWALILNSILMAFLFLSWKMILISLIPNIIPLIITLGIMGYGGIYLKPSTIIIFSITYGIAIDFTIHFLAKYRHFLKKHNWNMGIAVGDALKESGVSIVYTSLVLFCGFIIFAFSSFGGTVALGILTSVSLFIGMFTNIFLLPAMLLSLEKLVNARQEFGRAIVDLEGD